MDELFDFLVPVCMTIVLVTATILFVTLAFRVFVYVTFGVPLT